MTPGGSPFLIAGPCQIESYDHVVMMAERIAKISERVGQPIIFKASFDKANRTSGTSRRGAGMAVAIKAFEFIRSEFGLYILTDVHETYQVAEIAPVVDILQIPALLCRQTDLVEAAGRSGRAVNIKKGQGVAPKDMFHAVSKARLAGAKETMLTERGTTFGHGDLVVDMRGIAIMKRGSSPVIYDATHSVQTPGSANGATGGDRSMIEVLARAALGAGADGLFLETHQDPDNAPSDGPVMLPVDQLEGFLKRMIALFNFVQALPAS